MSERLIIFSPSSIFGAYLLLRSGGSGSQFSRRLQREEESRAERQRESTASPGSLSLQSLELQVGDSFPASSFLFLTIPVGLLLATGAVAERTRQDYCKAPLRPLRFLFPFIFQRKNNSNSPHSLPPSFPEEKWDGKVRVGVGGGVYV